MQLGRRELYSTTLPVISVEIPREGQGQAPTGLHSRTAAADTIPMFKDPHMGKVRGVGENLNDMAGEYAKAQREQNRAGGQLQ
ncbi:MAG: hypothetical protein QXZ31_11590 [Thermofilaceae archaeon]